MGKYTKKNLINQISHNTDEQITSDSSSFNMESFTTLSNEMYKLLIYNINGLSELDSPSFSKEVLFNLAEELYAKNMILVDEYQEKHNEYLLKINHISNQFIENIEKLEEQYEADVLQVDTDLENEYLLINEELNKFQTEAISRYKTEENEFIPKTKFLAENKKINKEEYIKIITEINQTRILANQKFHAIADDLTSKNEQQQLRFKHSLESSLEKNLTDKALIVEKADQKVLQIDNELQEKVTKNEQIIKTKEREIINNTVAINNLITKLGLEYENRLKYAYIPYDIKSNKLLDELSENNKIYDNLEEQVLIEFKTLLQQNDTEIETLREKHRIFTEKYLSDLRTLKKEFNSKLQRELNVINKEIAAATKKYTSSLRKEDKEIVKKLIREKKKFLTIRKREKIESINRIKNEYYLKELTYIERFERLRAKKSECEAIKSSAMKNINYERVYHHERINNELKLITSEKDSFTTTDHYEETKDIYKNRLKCDIENEDIRFDINTIELQIYKDKIESNHQQELILAEKEYNIALCDADLTYQQESINNRINYFNVITMLDIQKENIINEFEVLYANEKMNFEQVKVIFYNNCDNIQYELYKADNELKYKLIDTEVKLKQKLSELIKQHKKVLNSYKKHTLSYNKIHDENIKHIELYEDRLEIEKMMINNAYSLYINSMQNLMEFETFIHSNVQTLSRDSFNSNVSKILISLEYIRKIKLRIVSEYYNNIESIVRARLDFEKDMKFKKLFDSINKDWDEFVLYFNAKVDKTKQTITSYQNTVELSKDALVNNRKEIIRTRLSILKKLHRKNELITLKQDILAKKENIILIKKQIKANKRNIQKIMLLATKHNKDYRLREKIKNNRLKRAEKNQNNEIKIYKKIISVIYKHHNDLSIDLSHIGQYISASKYTYESLAKASAFILGFNNTLLDNGKNYFEIHYLSFMDSLTKQYSLQKETFNKNLIRFTKEIKKSIAIEDNEYSTTTLATNNAYNNEIEALERQNVLKKKNLLLELKKLNEQHIINYNNFVKTISDITEKKNYELSCHNDNSKMYLDSYNETNNKIIKKYLNKIEEIKLSYSTKVNKLLLKLKENKKKINVQQINNETLRKNNIYNLTNEYKENIKNTNIKIDNINRKDKTNRLRHDENKKISFKLYLLNQKNTRKEFSIQLHEAHLKCLKRIKTLQTEFKRQFKINKD